ncbi:hypothetical protein M422DRAFT_271171 [Sphaerobolus stellatus SS14]|uniref:Uncharacterized protein n=1 Tax=Sphaerobolus stellatus (strain SS14) TaxID=990650 RepID=A0A0C9UQL7_SPHS4|nr:hypothetical protein M422DRAFT_271171 [Sphaerobolus stellatus SS14]
MTTLHISISVILICRFLLELRKHSTSAQSVSSLNIETTPAFGIRGYLQCLNQSIIEEFGNSCIGHELEADEFMDDQESSGVIDTKLRINAEDKGEAFGESSRAR